MAAVDGFGAGAVADAFGFGATLVSEGGAVAVAGDFLLDGAEEAVDDEEEVDDFTDADAGPVGFDAPPSVVFRRR